MCLKFKSYFILVIPGVFTFLSHEVVIGAAFLVGWYQCKNVQTGNKWRFTSKRQNLGGVLITVVRK